MSNGTFYDGMYVVSEVQTGSGRLVVSVPEDVKLTINGREMRETGVERRFVSHGLHTGVNYSYEIKAQAIRNGVPVTKHANVLLAAGKQESLSFDFRDNQLPTKPVAATVRTTLTVSLPGDAKLYIDGFERSLTGDMRQFVTTKLEAGKVESCVVRATVKRGAKEHSKESVLTLKGGESHELAFTFDQAAMDTVAIAKLP